MSKEKNETELIQHKEKALHKLDSLMDELISSGDSKKKGKSDKLSYWLEDWTTFLSFEEHFSPASLRRYKRGEIIKVHLGFNVGSEEGGLHYAVVLDKNNFRTSPVVTVIPLTSVKPSTDLEHLKDGNVFLGREPFVSLNTKIDTYIEDLLKRLNSSYSQLMENEHDQVNVETLKKELQQIDKDIKLLKRMQDEISKMSQGSIALVNQITTISKIRIYDPKTNHDVLSGIRLSNDSLTSIDNEIKKMFIKM